MKGPILHSLNGGVGPLVVVVMALGCAVLIPQIAAIAEVFDPLHGEMQAPLALRLHRTSQVTDESQPPEQHLMRKRNVQEYQQHEDPSPQTVPGPLIPTGPEQQRYPRRYGWFNIPTLSYLDNFRNPYYQAEERPWSEGYLPMISQLPQFQPNPYWGSELDHSNNNPVLADQQPPRYLTPQRHQAYPNWPSVASIRSPSDPAKSNQKQKPPTDPYANGHQSPAESAFILEPMQESAFAKPVDNPHSNHFNEFWNHGFVPSDNIHNKDPVLLGH